MVYGTNGYCTSPAPNTSVGCVTWRGGQYNEVASTTRVQAASGSYPSEPSPYPDMDFVQDSMILNHNITVQKLDMGIPLEDWGEQGYHPMMAVGMGQDSTLLKALNASQQILSRTWSMFYGWTGDDSTSQLDGTFVLGGYDRAKVSGKGYPISATDVDTCSSQMMITIEDMVLNYPNGSTYSIFQGADGINACVVPDYPVLMTIPSFPYFSNFEDITGTSLSDRSFGLAYYSMLYSDGDNPYEGDLTFNIQSGPSIRIPNSQLVVSNRWIDESSGNIQVNASARNLVINPVDTLTASSGAQVGRQFLSAAYIMMNQDAGEFTLWPANPTLDVDLVAVGTDGTEATNYCSGSATSSTAPAGGAATTSASSSSGNGSGSGNSGNGSNNSGGSKKSSLSGGAIAGIAIGAVAIIAIIAVAAFFLLRRRGRVPVGAAELSAAMGGMSGAKEMPAGGADPTTYYSELANENQNQPVREFFKPELHGTPSPQATYNPTSMTAAGPNAPQHHYELVG